MIKAIDVITLYVTRDEVTGEERITHASKEETVLSEYQYEVCRFNGINEGGTYSPVKVFDSATECIEWINSLHFYSLGYKYSPTSWSYHANYESLCTRSYPIELDEPQLAQFRNNYSEDIDQYYLLTVNILPREEQG